MIKAITINGSIRIGVPKFWVMSDGTHDHAFNTRSDEVHFAEGYKEVITPVAGVDYNPETQRLGAIFLNTEIDKYTYPIIDKTEEELIQEVENQRQSASSQLLEFEKQRQAKAVFEAITDEAEAFAVKEVYDPWDENTNYLTGIAGTTKVTRILPNGEGGFEVTLFFLIQPHTPAIGDTSYYPENAPALWSRVIIGEGGIEVWTQPTGGDGKYPYLDPSTNQPYRVIHNGKLWENSHQGGLNVWEPGVFGWTDLGAI